MCLPPTRETIQHESPFELFMYPVMPFVEPRTKKTSLQNSIDRKYLIFVKYGRYDFSICTQHDRPWLLAKLIMKMSDLIILFIRSAKTRVGIKPIQPFERTFEKVAKCVL